MSTSPSPSIPFADARVRLKRDVLFTRTEEGVLFHNSHGGFQLHGGAAYRFASLVVPLLNGTYTVREVCGALPAQQQRMVSDLVGNLLSRGLARDVAPADESDGAAMEFAVREEFAQQIAFIDHFEDRSLRRFQAYRSVRIAVLGDDAIAGWFALSSLRNGASSVWVSQAVPGYTEAAAEARELSARGCPAEVGLLPQQDGLYGWDQLGLYDLIVCTGSRAPAQAAHLLKRGIPDGQRLLPLTRYGSKIVLGPMGRPDSDSCWTCGLLRLGFNQDSVAAADVWRIIATSQAGTERAPGKHLSAILGNLLAYEVFLEFTGTLPPETEDAVVVQDIDSFDTVVAPLLPHPLCPMCSAAGRATAPAQSLPALAQVSPPSLTSGLSLDPAESDAAIAELDRITGRLVDAHCGVFQAFDDDWPTQLPLKVSRVRFGIGAGRQRARTAFDLHHVAGARLLALCSAAGEYVEAVVPPAVVDAKDHPGVPLIAEASLTIFNGIGHTGTVGTGAGTSWSPAQSLVDGSRALIPTAAVRPSSAKHNAARTFAATEAGLGAGTSVEHALWRGFFSALAHDAILTAVRSGAGVSRIALDEMRGDEQIAFLLSSARNLRMDVEVLRLASPLGSTVVLARTCASDGASMWAAAADTCPLRAVTVALRDVVGQRQITSECPDEFAVVRQLVDSLDPMTLAVGPTPVSAGEAGDLSTIVAALRAAGRQVWGVADDCADLRQGGLHVVRVLLTTGTAA